jgi:hypothetical protein
MPILKNPSGQNPLALAGRNNCARTSTPYKMDSRDQVPPHEMSYPTAQTLQYGVTLAQESASVRPHVPTFMHCNWSFPRHRNATDCFILHRRTAPGATSATGAASARSMLRTWIAGCRFYLGTNAEAFARRSCSKQADSGVLTRSAARIECLSRAAPKRRHVLFSQDRLCRVRANARYVAGLQPQ